MPKFNPHREAAIVQKLDRYFTGKPCKRGHISDRRVINKNCIECEKEQERMRGIKQQRSQPDIKAKLQAYYKERAKDPQVRAKLRINARKHRTGATDAQVKQMLHDQWGACAICRRQLKLEVDHCHKTKKVRGLLCHGCNAGLGFFCDNPAYLNAAARYLQSEE